MSSFEEFYNFLEKQVLKYHLKPNAYSNDEAQEEMDNSIELWHRGYGVGQKLYEYLGFTWDEYKEWVEQTMTIKDIVEDRLNSL